MLPGVSLRSRRWCFISPCKWPSSAGDTCLEPDAHPFRNGCFNYIGWLHLNHYMEKWLEITRYPFKPGCLGYQMGDISKNRHTTEKSWRQGISDSEMCLKLLGGDLPLLSWKNTGLASASGLIIYNQGGPNLQSWRIISLISSPWLLPGTSFMDVWWNHNFPCKDFHWNNHFNSWMAIRFQVYHRSNGAKFIKWIL